MTLSTGVLPDPPSSAPLVSPWALSSFWGGSAFHWLLLLLILMPADVVRFVGEAHKGTYLGLLVGVGAILALILPPLIGTLSDKVGKRLAFLRWGVAINVAGLAVMGLASVLLGGAGLTGFWVYTLGYLLVQTGNNVATSPYSALIPDLVPLPLRGRYSGVMGQLQALGQLVGAVLAFGLGQLGLPAAVSYLLIAVVLISSAAITLRQVTEPLLSAQPGQHARWFAGSLGRALAVVAVLGALYLLIDKVAPTFSLYMAFSLPLLVVAAVIVALVMEWRGTVRMQPHPQLATRLMTVFLYQPFLWVFITRMLFSLGQYSVQPFLQFYNADVLKQANPGTATSIMLACIIVGSIVSAIIGGRLSDRIGRKPIIYVAGSAMAAAAVLLLFAPNFVAALLLALAFGLGYGAFVSVDWALGSDAMPSRATYARDMGLWHVAFVAPQLSSAPQGFLLDWGNTRGLTLEIPHLGYFIVFGIAAACFVLGVVLVRNIRGVR
ncbi:MFS transporter [Deinococcus sp. KNUC1210]|uniref:MFS transporter n=1 Tax=Deinococcus sp. KNUC1210 TaxID=2917691 RepID=UPI001EF0ACAA|nr:MFS transporter [Deinococcus sp. KNUC1210]ULH16275.1 MFS transporter [Deinococcus sp. KNUC1210]